MATSCAPLKAQGSWDWAVATALAVATLFVSAAGLVPETAAASTSAGPAYGWPVEPFDRQHPIRAYFGDPRIGMTPKGMHSGFHFGIDIACPNGTPVYATLDGVVRLESFRPETVAVVGRDGYTELQYWHIRPAVENGQRVSAYRTVVGWVQAPWEHVHFSEMRDDVYVNPLRPGALGPFTDATRPSVKQLRVSAGGSVIPPRAVRGSVELVVEAYDETPVPVPGPWGGKPVTPALLRWRVTRAGGSVVRGWRTAIDHRLVKPDDGLFTSRYARWTRQNKRNRIGRYRFVLAAAWDTGTFADGRYVVEVTASDVSGNRTVARFPIRIANRGARLSHTRAMSRGARTSSGLLGVSDLLATRDQAVWARSDARLQHGRR